MPFFVKTTLTGAEWAWCYVENVSKVAKGLLFTSPQVPRWPDVEPGASTVLFNSKHTWDVKQGWIHAFPVVQPFWMQLAPDAPAPKIPEWIPEKIRKEGIESSLEYALKRGAIKGVFARDEIRNAIAVDMALDAIAHSIFTPQFIPLDDQRIDEWAKVRPDCYALAKKDADELISKLGLTEESEQVRRRLRMEAHRKLDATREDFGRTNCLGGDPWTASSKDGVQIKFGTVANARYPMGEGDSPVHPYVDRPEIVEWVEGILLPYAAEWDGAFELFHLRTAFTTWEATHPFPSIGYRHWAPGAPPKGMVSRPGLIEPAVEHAALGISSLLSEPAAEYASTLNFSDLPSPTECARFCLRRAWLD